MGTQLDIAKHRLFDEERLYASNIKLFPGSSRDATPEQMSEQINKALTQIELGDFDMVELSGE